MTQSNLAACFTFLVVSSCVGSIALAGQSKESKSPSLKSTVSQTKEACNKDLQKYCNGVQPGEGRLAKCLNSNEEQLSDSCNTARMHLSAVVSEKIDQANVAFRKDCGQDLTKFCSDVPSGKGRLLDCIGKHQSELSSSCKEFQSKLETKLNEAFN